MEDKTKAGLIEEIEVPSGVRCEIKEGILKVEGKYGIITKSFHNPQIKIGIEKGRVTVEAKKETKREKKIVGSLKSHIKNMIKGATEGYVYKLKICSGHFPMNVSVTANNLVVKNFLGEKIPRRLKLKEGVRVKVDGDLILVESANKELAGQVAADIEQLTRITDKDKRVFQDGIYILEKGK